MCTLNINNDCDHWFLQDGDWTCARNYGIEKNPLECHGRYFFLWDEPMTQGLDAVWAAEQWIRHVDRWGPQIRAVQQRRSLKHSSRAVALTAAPQTPTITSMC